MNGVIREVEDDEEGPSWADDLGYDLEHWPDEDEVEETEDDSGE